VSTQTPDSRSEAARRAGGHWRVWAYITFVGLAACAVSVAAVSTAHPLRHHALVPWPAIAVALTLALIYPVEFHIGRQTLSQDLASLVILVGVLTTGPRTLILAGLCGVGAAAYKLRYTPARALLNAANVVLALSVNLLAMHALLGRSTPDRVGSWPGLIALMLLTELTTFVVVFGVVTVSSGRPERSYLKSIGTQYAVFLPLNAGLGILAVTLAWNQPWALVPLVILGAGLALWYRKANKIHNRFADLQKLYGFTVRLSGSDDASELLSNALEEAKSLLHSQYAGAFLPEGEGSVYVHYELGASGRITRSPAEIPSELQVVLQDGSSLLVPRGKPTPLAVILGLGDLLATRIEFGDGRSGVLVLGDREGRLATFDDEDQRLLEALAANMGTALTSSRRLDKLRSEMDLREYEARHDKLTGLANRSSFTSWLQSGLERRQKSELLAVVLMDLDGFKEINDTLGHHIGDEILQETARRMRGISADTRLAARLGGDEFAILIPLASSTDEVIKAAEAALASVACPIATGGVVLEIRASAGLALAPLHGTDPTSLLKRAEVAMYEAKRSHRGLVTYDPSIDHNTTRRLHLATELRRAIAADELEVYYQPVAELRSGDVRGFEALLRWRHSHYGSVSPNEFIPVAEQTGIIGELTWWVLDKALRQLRRWQEEGYDFHVAVNLSARSLLDSGLVARLRQMLEDLRVRPGTLTLEITESSIMVEPERSERVLESLAELGVHIAIDDYGTGYSSLSRLQRLPVTTVKIDRSFVMHMCADSKDEAIVRATIELARNLGHVVVAEGVEDLSTWERLAELGCDQAQGYYLTPPIPAEECGLWLRSRESSRLAPVRHLWSVSQGA
jgi:diguanylate cyclase (GGDEF)-like protein